MYLSNAVTDAVCDSVISSIYRDVRIAGCFVLEDCGSLPLPNTERRSELQYGVFCAISYSFSDDGPFRHRLAADTIPITAEYG